MNYHPFGYLALAVAALLLSSSALEAQIFVTDNADGTIGEYTTSGATINASLVSGLNYPEGVVVSGGDLFVANYGAGTVGEYTTSGATVNASLISGLDGPSSIALSGGDFYVTNFGGETLGEYNSSGALVSGVIGVLGAQAVAVGGPFYFAIGYSPDYGIYSPTVMYGIGGSLTPCRIALFQNPLSLATYIDASDNLDLFVGEGSEFTDTGMVYEYTNLGAAPTYAVGGPGVPYGMAVSGGDLYVASYGSSGAGTIGEYNASTGATINTSLISGLNTPYGIAVEGLPEPTPTALVGAALLGLCAVSRPRRGRNLSNANQKDL